MPYLYSTASCSVIFNIFGEKPNEESPPPVVKKIHVRGGANVAQRRADGGAMTFEGFKTFISEEELKDLELDHNFRHAVEVGFIKVTDDNQKISKAVKDLNAKDGSAPKVLNDFPKEDPEKSKSQGGVGKVQVASVGAKEVN